MPTYDFKCTECNNVFEKNVPMAEYRDKQPCGSCGGVSIRKITFAGSVWAPTSTGSNHK